MSAQRVLFIDRDGTLIEEPPDRQIDSLAEAAPHAGRRSRAPAAARCRLRVRHGHATRTASARRAFPKRAFREPHEFLLELLGSQGIGFDAVFVCPHLPDDGCACRKPKTGLVDELPARRIRSIVSRSYVIGDRDTDMEFARNLGVPGLRVRRTRRARPGRRSLRASRRVARAHGRSARRRKPTSTSTCDLDRRSADHASPPASASSITCSNRSRSTAASRCELNVQRRSAHRRAPHRRRLRAGARAGAADGARRQARHRALRLPAADGRSAGAGRHRSLRPPLLRVRRQVRPRPASGSCPPSSCRTSSARWPRRSARRSTSRSPARTRIT